MNILLKLVSRLEGCVLVRVCTIGHSDRGFGEFVGILKRYGVNVELLMYVVSPAAVVFHGFQRVCLGRA